MKKVILSLCVLLSCGMVHGMDKKNRYVQVGKQDSFHQETATKLKALQESNPVAFNAASDHIRYTKEEAAMNNLLNDTKNGVCCVIL